MNVNVFKGKLLEQFCRLLLEGSGYILCQEENKKVRYRKTNAIVEMRGRGTWHQIDLPYDFRYTVPFTNPIRVIGEVKYYKDPIEKDLISGFIGVTRDICENYFADDKVSNQVLCSRKLEQPLFVSATGFQNESQKLAFAHNIHLLSFHGNPILKSYLLVINDFAEMIFTLPSKKRESAIKNALRENWLFLSNGQKGNKPSSFFENVRKDDTARLSEILFENVKSHFIATTNTGQIMCFVSSSSFPFELFRGTEPAHVRIEYYKEKGNKEIDPYIKLSFQDETSFFSTLPDLLYEEFTKEHRQHGNAINAKEHHFSPLTIYKKDQEENIHIFQVSFEKNGF